MSYKITFVGVKKMAKPNHKMEKVGLWKGEVWGWRRTILKLKTWLGTDGQKGQQMPPHFKQLNTVWIALMVIIDELTTPNGVVPCNAWLPRSPSSVLFLRRTKIVWKAQLWGILSRSTDYWVLHHLLPLIQKLNDLGFSLD